MGGEGYGVHGGPSCDTRFGVGSGNGGSFILGQTNAATAITRLAGTQGVDGAMFGVKNNNADANDTALSLKVQAGEPPMKVNSSTMVANLNADKIDSLDSTDFQRANAQAGGGLSGNYPTRGSPLERSVRLSLRHFRPCTRRLTL